MRLISNFSCPVILSVLALVLTGCVSRMEAMLSTNYTIQPEPVEPWEDGEIPVAADTVKKADVYILLRNTGTKPIRIEWVSFSKRGIQPLDDRGTVLPELEPGEVIAYKSKTDPCWLPPKSSSSSARWSLRFP